MKPNFHQTGVNNRDHRPGQPPSLPVRAIEEPSLPVLAIVVSMKNDWQQIFAFQK
jgi:hypothetical protein